MGSKIQGEGDYESAKRFNKAEQDFVKRKYRKKEALEEADLEGMDNESIDDDEDTQIAESAGLDSLRNSTDRHLDNDSQRR